MNPRILIVVVLALVCGLSAMFLVQALRRPVSAPTVERAGVVFATEDVKAGEVVTEKGLEVRQVPVEQVPEGAVKTIAEAVDRAARSTIDKGDMIREVKLAEKGAGRGLAALVDPGMRAVVIQTPSFSASLGGFLQPGNHVDINLTLSSSTAGREPPRTLLEDVEVLAVDKNVNQPTSNKINNDETRFVTVEVNPEDALKLDFGQNAGVLTLKLRNPGDKARDPSRLMTLAELQGYKPKGDGEAPPPKPLDQLVAVGKQAFTIDADSFSATLAGHLAPESRVDVLLTAPGEGRADAASGAARVAGTGEPVGGKAQGDGPGKPATPAAGSVPVAGGGGASTRTLLKDVRVLMVQSKEDGPNIVRGTSTADSRYVTLEVDPAEARQLDLAQQVGKLHLSLRGAAPPGFARLRQALAKFAGRVADGVREVAATGTAMPAAADPTPNSGGDGDLLVASQLGMSPPPPPATRPALDRLIAPGMQAFTVDADSFSGTLAGHLAPDSRVDVLLTSETHEKYKEYTGGASTRTLLGDVRVLLVQPKGAGPNAAADVADARYVTLEVTADQARRLDLGQKMGKLHLSLRSATRAEGPSPATEPTAPESYARVASAEADEPGAEPEANPDLLLFHDLKMVPAGGGGGAGGPKVLADMEVRTMRGTRAGRDSWTVVDDPAARRAARSAPAAPTSRPESRPRRPVAREPFHLTGSR